MAIIVLVLAILCAGCGLALGVVLGRIHAEWVQLRQAVERLERGGPKRNPYKTNEGLEDAMAVIHDAAHQAAETVEYIERRLGQARTILGTVRRDPEEYDPETPNRKEVRQ